MAEYDEVLELWFGALDSEGQADEAHASRWWRKDPAFDRELRDRFGSLHAEIMRGEHREWLAEPRGVVAMIIVLDQLSRNMFRGTEAMFASDPLARELAERAIDDGVDRELRAAEKYFLYMPLMHAEDLAAQERCVALFTALRDAATGKARDGLDGAVRYAAQHRDIVKRFGRFPHRNATLGRTSTAEELAFLEQPGSSF